MTEYVEHNRMHVVEKGYQRRAEALRAGRELMRTRLAKIELVNEPPHARHFMDRNDMPGVLWTVAQPIGDFAERIYHCLDGPAKIDAYGKEWIVAGLRHRIDGPAVEDKSTSHKTWYLYGIPIYTYKEFQKAAECTDDDIIILKLKWGEM